MSGDKLWSGRFQQGPDPRFEAFSRSLPDDLHLLPYDLRVSMAHARALEKAGILSREEARRITEALEELLAAGEASFPWEPGDEDVHSAVERILRQKVGEAALRLHAGRSRNDQVATDAHLYAADQAEGLAARCLELAEVVVQKADEVGEAAVLGRTHLQPAQPVLLAHHLLAYGWMALRDAERFRGVAASARRFCPLGAGALAGTGFRLPVEETAEALGFLAPYPNSIDAVSDRDFLAELLFACALTMAHLSRLAEELVLWSTPEFGTVALSEGFTTGSSMMPQKKNPDSAELIRGKAGAVFGELLALLVLLKGLPLAYMRDLQEDKPPVYRAVATTEACLVVMAGALGEATFRASEPPLGDFSLATELADWLVEQGLPFREAHRVVGGLVRLAEERGGTFVALTAEEFQKASPLFPEDVGPLLSPRRALERRAARGGTAPLRVAEQKEELRQAILRLRAEPRA